MNSAGRCIYHIFLYFRLVTMAGVKESRKDKTKRWREANVDKV